MASSVLSLVDPGDFAPDDSALADLSLSFTDTIKGLWQNAYYGTLNDAQVDALATQEANNRVKASAGTISFDDAKATALGDVHTVLKQDNADPSQSKTPSIIADFEWVLTIAAIGFLLYFILEAVRLFRA